MHKCWFTEHLTYDLLWLLINYNVINYYKIQRFYSYLTSEDNI